MRSRHSPFVVAMVGLVLVCGAASAQTGATRATPALLASPTLSPEARQAIQDRIDSVHARFRDSHAGLGPEQFGVQCCQIMQIPAAAFAPYHDEPEWANDFNGLGYRFRGGNASSRLWAPVLLPSGVEIQYLDLYYYDIDPANDIRATLIAFSGGTPFSGLPDFATLTTAESSSSAGYGYAVGQIAYTVNNYVAYDPAGAQLVVELYSPITNADLRFKAVDLWWMRQVSPAPATPTFNDVPPSDPAFQFIEALAASGITAGCGGGNYCPDNPLTRRQMAVFLSKSLGLYWLH